MKNEYSPDHRAGYVNIIGRPNAGKSTLINGLMKEKLAIVSPKAQTTRHRILGILNEQDYQLILSDTPGMIDPAYKLQERMMTKVKEAFEDADVLLYVADIQDDKQDILYLDKLQRTQIPLIVLINKIDMADQQKLEEKVTEWANRLPQAEILPISALHETHLDLLLNKLVSLLPKSPPYYSKDEFTDKPERFFVNEILREKILAFFDKEIPFSVEVVTESFKRQEDRIHIESTIYVERDSQKGIIIGHQGKMLSKLGAAARKDLADFFGERIYLGLYVKVLKDWRRKDQDLKRFGYE